MIRLSLCPSTFQTFLPPGHPSNSLRIGSSAKALRMVVSARITDYPHAASAQPPVRCARFARRYPHEGAIVKLGTQQGRTEEGRPCAGAHADGF